MADNSIAKVLKPSIRLAAHYAVIRNVKVHVSAVIALHTGRAEARRNHQCLHLACFDRSQYPAQPDGAASIAMCLADYFGDHLLLAVTVVLLQLFVCQLFYLLRGCTLGIDTEAPR